MKQKSLSFAAILGSAFTAFLCAWALSISVFNTYGLASKRFTLSLGLFFVLATAGCYLLLERFIRPRWKEIQFRQLFVFTCIFLLVIGFAVADIASWDHPNRIFILPSHTVKISLPDQETGRQFHLVWFKTGLREISARELKLEGKWEENGGYLLSTSQAGSTIQWSGPTGSELTLVMQSEPGGGNIEFTLDGNREMIRLEDNAAQAGTIRIKTPVPLYDRALGIGLISLLVAVSLLAVLLGGCALVTRFFPRLRTIPIPYLPLQRQQWINLALLITVGGFAAIHFYNNIFPWLNLNSFTGDQPTRTFSIQPITFVMTPVGQDFRYGFYYPGKDFLVNSDPYDPNGDHRGSKAVYTPQMYPPLMNLVALPYTLFSEDQAYAIHVVILFLANIACLVISGMILKKYLIPLASFENEPGCSIQKDLAIQKDRMILGTLFAAMIFYTFNAYGFQFSIERGNVDILALLFALLALLCLLAAPEKIWLQVLLLSIAAHIKVYPAILFALLFFKHRWKIVIPSLVVNLALLLITGPGYALGFIKNLLYMGEDPAQWIGNHSGVSFAWLLIKETHGQFLLNEHTAGLLFTALPIVIWAAAMPVLFFRKYSPLTIIWGLLISIPVMELVPGRSHDYRLVIENVAFLMMLMIIMLHIIRAQKWYDFLQLVLLLFLIGAVGRPYTLFLPGDALLANKYIPILLFQILIFLNLMRPALDRFSLTLEPVS